MSDGAEDESIVPIIQSRVKIDSVRRVVVKQSEHLESTFYVIKRLFEDPKVFSHVLATLRSLFVPLSHFFAVWDVWSSDGVNLSIFRDLHAA